MIERTEDVTAGPAGSGAYLPADIAAPSRTAGVVAAGRAGPACSPMEQFKLGMRRFRDNFRELPFDTRATCPTCGKVVDATFAKTYGGVAVTFHCRACGSRRHFHHDAIYTPRPSDRPGSPTHTLAGTPILPVLRGLPRTVSTLCPDCHAILVGRYFVEGGAVWIEKTCPEHGHFRDCINRDALLYAKAMYWSFEEHAGQAHPQVCGATDCPSDCGLCNQHQSSACLANIDLTNRCNLRCPICFANAGAAGYVYEPSYQQVMAMLQQLRDLRPIPATAVQFSGGEPTLHPDFHRIVAAAKQMGFSNIQIATNGLTHADPQFARASAAAGLHTLYLQFDGVGEEAYRHTRAHPGLWAKKLACVANCRQAGLKICLVPTIVRGVNDNQVGPIIRFALENIDVVSAISFQPVSFSGRMDPSELSARRYTVGDLARDIADATGGEPLRDMFPLSIVMPLSQILQALTGQPKIRASCHPDCAFGTYFLVAPDGTPYPFPKVIDVEGMFSDMNRIAARITRRGKAGWLDKLATYRMFKRHFRPASAPQGLTTRKFIHSLMGMVDKAVGRGEGEKSTYKTLMCAGMHFQDAYNYDVERVKRCVILYSTPDGIFPFCSYNCGPSYRRFVEKAHSRPVGQPKQAGVPMDAVPCAQAGQPQLGQVLPLENVL
jgi:7,8-dihydro-6-hydroxymethylpterin dimethyltransferase